MSVEIDNTKRIVKNTIYLYFRMLIVMGVTLFTTREVLNILGVIDFGIYNVVGGIVSMFSFLSGTLNTSSQRFFSLELVKGDFKSLSNIFCTNINAFFFLSIGIILMLETLGLWFLNYKMIIPEERIFAVNIVYQLSIFTFVVNLLSIPYTALIIAHEKMNFFSFIGILEALLKLGIVGLLYLLVGDNLIIYGFLILCTSLLVLFCNILYCRKHYKESKFRWYINISKMRELLSFSGWHFLGTMSVVFRSYGVNILINLFFNPAVNAARAISFQVNTAAVQLSNNFFTAVKPQMYKLYLVSDFDKLFNMIFWSTKLSIFLVSIIALPIILDTHYLLSLWLKQVPEHSLLFTQLVLVESMIMGANGATVAPALATGKIKWFEIVTSGVSCLIFPVAYFSLYFGNIPESTVIISIILVAVTIFVQAYMLKRMMQFPFIKYSLMILKIILVTLFVWYVMYKVLDVSGSFMSLLINIFCSFFLLLIFYYLIVLSSLERSLIKKKMSSIPFFNKI